MMPNINLYQRDCLPAMQKMADNEYDLAIVDPPYGIGGGSNVVLKRYDDSIPDKSYFIELIRISKNQIIWGGNYMSTNIPFNSKHTIIWDKENGDSFMSDGEIAFTSFDKQTTRFYKLFWMSNMMKAEEKPLIHINQKPIALYKWLLKNYAKEGDKILDTHGGSMAIAIACWDYGYDLDLYEIDKDYYEAGKERLETHKKRPAPFFKEQDLQSKNPKLDKFF